ncbi:MULTISPECIES: fdrA domain protein [unclassified Candidatus Frackibacter]|uniref:fdrA domain protein n=1 Tax=unclassified Candidatus Frackibacter TaxID=2648818 RepID=UPI000796262B|nr:MULTISPECIES: fdrA domain protein [unclassified Candidatus Frackibacter]KXS45280.1 MAG: hypothetical protein AWU54_534 [Candidatus Frackibacter sp. T328-2]SDC78968.1 hypothetical protein SAMN04515661_12522 [Candidatus Frackibacter sp. WG11]SEM91747.1 hypothetical protein SAMN04488698_12522 [Candidatus Frackibacter sp. WG12]SFM01515.1 hypothetical protein SAMN04488699_12622 [Candidatus Frackibacter sp. WG13]
MEEKILELFGKKLKVINIGLESFAESLKEEGVDVIQMDWEPPAGGDAELASLLDSLMD